MHTSSWPPPHPDAIQLNEQLITRLTQTIHDAGGAIPFAEFMNQALYTSGLGYYSAGICQFGMGGDFITAPEISPFFSHGIAQQCQQVLATLQQGDILEFGAGSGIMAAEILKALERLNSLPNQYLILEVSAYMQQQQRETLQTHVPHLLERIHWLNRLPTKPFLGIILANEVLDAMPVHRFRLDEMTVSEAYVGIVDQQFVWQMLPTQNETLKETVNLLRPQCPIGYISEINLALPAWIHSLSDKLAQGLILLIDYGFPRQEYYHPQRHQGTLMCHYQHHAHTDPLILVGLQDITAHIDFTAVAEAAVAANLQVAGYTQQAHFLLACGLMDMLSAGESQENNAEYLQKSQQVKTLIMPHEMGELFKVMALTRNLDLPLMGFVKDERFKL